MVVTKKKWCQMAQTDDANSFSVSAGPGVLEQTFLGLVSGLVGSSYYILLQPMVVHFLKIQFCQYIKYPFFSKKTRAYNTFDRQLLSYYWETVCRMLCANKGKIAGTIYYNRFSNVAAIPVP